MMLRCSLPFRFSRATSSSSSRLPLNPLPVDALLPVFSFAAIAYDASHTAVFNSSSLQYFESCVPLVVLFRDTVTYEYVGTVEAC